MASSTMVWLLRSVPPEEREPMRKERRCTAESSYRMARPAPGLADTLVTMVSAEMTTVPSLDVRDSNASRTCWMRGSRHDGQWCTIGFVELRPDLIRLGVVQNGRHGSIVKGQRTHAPTTSLPHTTRVCSSWWGGGDDF